MNNRGHGLFQYTLPTTDSDNVTVPSISANTFEISIVGGGYRHFSQSKGVLQGRPTHSDTKRAKPCWMFLPSLYLKGFALMFLATYVIDNGFVTRSDVVIKVLRYK